MSAASEIEVRLDKDLNPEAVAALYREAGWLEADAGTEFITPMLSGSCLVAAAFCNGELVGMARALSDGVSDACIQDVVVAFRQRRRGLGARLVKCLLAGLEERGVDFIELIGAPGTEKLYRECGFEPMAGHTPMLYRPRD